MRKQSTGFPNLLDVCREKSPRKTLLSVIAIVTVAASGTAALGASSHGPAAIRTLPSQGSSPGKGLSTGNGAPTAPGKGLSTGNGAPTAPDKGLSTGNGAPTAPGMTLTTGNEAPAPHQ